MSLPARVAVDPVRSVLIELPIVVHAATAVALIGHAIFGDVAWYRAALVASVAGIAAAIAATVPGLADLVGLAASRWRSLGRRQAACNAIAVVACSAASASIYTSYAWVHELDDGAPLAFVLVGLTAAIAAAWLGRTMVALLDRPPPIASELVARLPSPRRG